MEKDSIITAAILAVLMLIRDVIKDITAKRAARKLATVHAAEIEDKSNKHSLEYLNEINRQVTHETKKIRDRHQSMRVYVIHFSNGTVTEAGLSLMKVTFKHEVVIDWQVEPVSRHFQEYPMPEMFLSSMTSVIRTGQYYLKNRNDLNVNDANHRDYFDWLKAYKVNSCMWLPIKKNGKIAAILVAHWPATTDLDGSVIAKIKDINRNIEGIYARI
jgi:hypothetical protein